MPSIKIVKITGNYNLFLIRIVNFLYYGKYVLISRRGETKTKNLPDSGVSVNFFDHSAQVHLFIYRVQTVFFVKVVRYFKLNKLFRKLRQFL